MLRGIDPLLSPDLLHCLALMGHGDSIAIVDANFPAQTMGKRVVRMDGKNASEALRAVLSLLPLDDFIDDAAISMSVVGDPDAIPEAVAEFQEIITECAENPCQIAMCDRFDFYDKARNSFVVLQVTERRLYGNIILTKGVIR